MWSSSVHWKQPNSPARPLITAPFCIFSDIQTHFTINCSYHSYQNYNFPWLTPFDQKLANVDLIYQKGERCS